MVRRGICGSSLQSDARHGAELCVADNTPPCEIRQGETDREAVWTISHNGQVSEFAELNHFREPQKAGDMSKHRYKTGCALPCNDRSSGGQKGCMACCKHAGANPRDSRTRSLDTVDTQCKFKRLTIKTTVQFEQRHHARLKWWHSAGCGWTDPRRRTAT